MNPRPELKFQLNIELDKRTCTSSVFHTSVIKLHPALAKDESLEYVDDYYKTHEKELKNAVEKMKTDWLTIERKFFEIVSKLVNHPWPKGKYVCYLSIFNCNPRFIETKEFQAYFKHPETTNHVCAHELLHFIFYDYFEKNFSEDYKKLDSKYIWRLSEIVNDVLLRLPEFVAITGRKAPAVYAETTQELASAIKLWSETKTVKAFVTNYLVHWNTAEVSSRI